MTSTREFWAMLATLIASVFVLGFVAGDALGATASPSACNRAYPIGEMFVVFGFELNAHPLGADYARCLFSNPCTLAAPCTTPTTKAWRVVR